MDQEIRDVLRRLNSDNNNCALWKELLTLARRAGVAVEVVGLVNPQAGSYFSGILWEVEEDSEYGLCNLSLRKDRGIIPAFEFSGGQIFANEVIPGGVRLLYPNTDEWDAWGSSVQGPPH